MVKRLSKNFIALVFWLCMWALAARLVDRELLLPGPWTVLWRLGELTLTAAFWQTVVVSLARILLGAIEGILLGTILAVVSRHSRLFDALLSPLLSVVRSTPVASFILLVLIWVGRDFVPSVIVVLIVIPVVWGNVSQGIAGADPSLLEMAQVYRFGPWRTALRVYVPAVLPHFLSACRTGLGLAWKAGVAAEVLTVPKLSIGKKLFESKLNMETADLFAWTVVVIFLSLIIEKLLSALLRRLPTGGDRK